MPRLARTFSAKPLLSENAAAESKFQHRINRQFVHPFLPVVIIVERRDLLKFSVSVIELHLAMELHAELNAEIQSSFSSGRPKPMPR